MFEQDASELDPMVSRLSRRSILGGLGGAGLMAASPALADGHGGDHGKELDFTKQKDRMTALIKMRTCMDNRIVFGGVKGLYYGVVDGKLTPLYGVLAGTMARYNMRDENTIEGVSFEVAYFTDWNTGELLETFDNPYTGETVEVPQTRMGPSAMEITYAGRTAPSENPRLRGFSIDHRFIAPRNERGTVVLVEETIVASPEDFPGPGIKYNEVTTYRAQMSDLVNPEVMIANDSTHFNGIISWRPWLKMGDHPGHLFGTATGGRYAGKDEYPAYYVELTDKYHPDVFADTAALLENLE